MDSNFQIIEKPDWVSWDDIHHVLWGAHAGNREKGIAMRYASLSGEEIRQRVEGKGKMLVAVSDKTVIGTSAIVVKKVPLWCDRRDDRYGYICFASVLPSYNGKGVFKALDKKREELAIEMGLNKLLGDTHEHNYHRLEIAKKVGYKFVDLKYYKDHYNVVMVKWLDGCPYSQMRCKLEYLMRKILVKTRVSISKLFRRDANV